MHRRTHSSKAAVVIFGKYPQEGFVKTRLADVIGRAPATSIYRHLLIQTISVASKINAVRYLAFDRRYPSRKIDEYTKRVDKIIFQKGLTLGARMINALENVFMDGAQKAVVVGSDCPEIESKDVEKALRELHEIDVVIGPTPDGGFYLIALNKKVYQDNKGLLMKEFNSIKWSTSKVLSQTTQALENLGLSYAFLRIRDDIDDVGYFRTHGIETILK